MGRDSSSSSKPYFCKFLKTDEDCSSKFQIPPEFVEIYGENLPENVTFRIHGSDKSWRVGIEKIEGNYFFTDDWNRFAEEADVKLHDYLIFKFLGFSQASSNEFSLCHKDFSSGGDDEGSPGKTKNKIDEHEREYEYGILRKWRFVKELKETDARRMSIPKEFAYGTGIAKHRRLVLVDASGNKWPVRVIDKNRGLFAMTSGWRQFLEGNNVSFGSTISFEFISGSENLVKTRVIEEPFASEEEEEDSDLESNAEVSGVGRKWRFVKDLKHHHAFSMDIPREFVVGTGIGVKGKIKLRVGKGKIWPVGLKYKQRGAVCTSAGWKDFLVGNKVRVGSIILFEFVENTKDDIIQVRLLDKGIKGNVLFKTIKKKMG